MASKISQIFAIKDPDYDPQWNLKVTKVALLLSSSRSGSSLLVSMLRNSPDIYSLDGEIDPYLGITGNGFPHTSDSDQLSRVYNERELLEDIFQDLGVHSNEICSFPEIKSRWQRRLLMQFPLFFGDENNFQAMSEAIDIALQNLSDGQSHTEKQVHESILSAVFSTNPQWRGFYDSYGSADALLEYKHDAKIEEPPFIVPRLHKKAVMKEDLEQKVLLFKTPQDAYRLPIYRQLFPNAEIKYVHLVRGYAQAVNGLVDGWISSKGFFAHDVLRATEQPLQIKGYSDIMEFGHKWWKFDLPPNWESFRNANIFDVCCNQWTSSHSAILEAKDVKPLRVKFEDILGSRRDSMQTIARHLGISLQHVEELPLVMTTKQPKPARWRERERELLPLGEDRRVRDIMSEFAYSTDNSRWF